MIYIVVAIAMIWMLAIAVMLLTTVRIAFPRALLLIVLAAKDLLVEITAVVILVSVLGSLLWAVSGGIDVLPLSGLL